MLRPAAEEFESVTCPLCGGDKLKRLAHVGQLGLPCHVSMCRRDGMVFLSPRWTAERYQRYYAEHYDADYRAWDLETVPDDTRYAPIEAIHRRIGRLSRFQEAHSVLDVGAGMGWSLEWLRAHCSQFSAFAAIEPSQHCGAHIERMGAQLLANDVYADWGPQCFDFIILRHVVEHLLSPVEALAIAQTHLSEAGIVYIAVPNMMRPNHSLQQHIFRAPHVWYFAQPTLLHMTARAGLSPLVLNATGPEVWGVFERDPAARVPSVGPEHYRQQLAVIRRARLRDLLRPITRRLRRGP